MWLCLLVVKKKHRHEALAVYFTCNHGSSTGSNSRGWRRQGAPKVLSPSWSERSSSSCRMRNFLWPVNCWLSVTLPTSHASLLSISCMSIHTCPEGVHSVFVCSLFDGNPCWTHREQTNWLRNNILVINGIDTDWNVSIWPIKVEILVYSNAQLRCIFRVFDWKSSDEGAAWEAWRTEAQQQVVESNYHFTLRIGDFLHFSD